jgi:AcrR family transcriptional regulator
VDVAVHTANRIVTAARDCLLAEGYANLSTRHVAERAGVPLSQIHYHFGGRQGLVLALLAAENERLVERQQRMYATDAPLSVRYEQACDYLDEDLASGYVRVLQEMVAAGWSDPAVAEQVVTLLKRWLQLLDEVATEAERDLGRLGPFTAREVSMLVAMAFLGGESMLLLTDPEWSTSVRAAIRRVGELIREAEAPASLRTSPRTARRTRRPGR